MLLIVAQGSTMLYITIKSGTLKCYLTSVGPIALDSKYLDPLLNDRGKDYQCITNALSDVKRLESMPTRRESFTVKIVPHTLNKCDPKYLDSLCSVT